MLGWMKPTDRHSCQLHNTDTDSAKGQKDKFAVTTQGCFYNATLAATKLKSTWKQTQIWHKRNLKIEEEKFIEKLKLGSGKTD